MSETLKRLRELERRDMVGEPVVYHRGIWKDAADALEDAKREEIGLSKLVHRQSKLLTGVVNALRGGPPSDGWHSHHDAPQLAERMVAERDALRRHKDALVAQCVRYAKRIEEMRLGLYWIRAHTRYQSDATSPRIYAMADAVLHPPAGADEPKEPSAMTDAELIFSLLETQRVVPGKDEISVPRHLWAECVRRWPHVGQPPRSECSVEGEEDDQHG